MVLNQVRHRVEGAVLGTDLKRDKTSMDLARKRSMDLARKRSIDLARKRSIAGTHHALRVDEEQVLSAAVVHPSEDVLPGGALGLEDKEVAVL